MASNKTVIVRGDVQREELKAAGAITPGHFLELDSSGDVIVHNSAGQNITPLIALENDIRGNDIDDAYADNEQVQCAWAKPGTTVNALLANGQNAAIGGFCESAGDGTVTNHTPDDSTSTIYANQIIGVYREAVDMSDSSAADPSPRILITIV